MPKLKKREIERNCYASKKILFTKKTQENLASKKSTRKKKRKKKAKWPAVAGKRTPVTGAET